MLTFSKWTDKIVLVSFLCGVCTSWSFASSNDWDDPTKKPVYGSPVKTVSELQEELTRAELERKIAEQRRAQQENLTAAEKSRIEAAVAPARARLAFAEEKQRVLGDGAKELLALSGDVSKEADNIASIRSIILQRREAVIQEAQRNQTSGLGAFFKPIFGIKIDPGSGADEVRHAAELIRQTAERVFEESTRVNNEIRDAKAALAAEIARHSSGI